MRVLVLLALLVGCGEYVAPQPILLDQAQCGQLSPTHFSVVYRTATGRDTGAWLANHFEQPIHFRDTLVTTLGPGRLEIVRGSLIVGNACITYADSLVYRSDKAVHLIMEVP